MLVIIKLCDICFNEKDSRKKKQNTVNQSDSQTLKKLFWKSREGHSIPQYLQSALIHQGITPSYVRKAMVWLLWEIKWISKWESAAKSRGWGERQSTRVKGEGGPTTVSHNHSSLTENPVNHIPSDPPPDSWCLTVHFTAFCYKRTPCSSWPLGFFFYTIYHIVPFLCLRVSALSSDDPLLLVWGVT